MIQSNLVQAHRNFSLLLICAMLGACATTQKSSSGSGEQVAAPISDSATPQSAAKPGVAPGSSSASAANPSSQPDAAKSTGKGATSSNAGAKQGGSPESGVAVSGNDEETQLKRQLADQDAEINKLRNEQQAVAEREEAEAAKMREEQAAANAAPGESASSPAAASAARSKGQDEAVVFPANTNATNASTAQASGAESGESAAPPATVERSVYFAYDQAVVAEKYDDMLVANAAWLKAHPAAKSEVQGNCDERGSREYNLALGARRAQAVKRALELAGADGDRIAAISYGAEKPVATGKDEASYSRNRRADIVY